MGWLKAVLIGLLQGMTEFLPVSSSGHQVLGGRFMHLSEASTLSLLLWTHLGTLIAVLWFFRRDLLSMASGCLRRDSTSLKHVGLIVLATLPTGLIGLGLQKWVNAHLESLLPVGVAFLCTATALFLVRDMGRDGGPIGWRVALWVGIFQGIAVIPGISRSGSTLAVALFLGIKSKTAFRFSFLVSIPAVAGAFLLEAVRRHVCID